ncbi:SDR family oxidoreductase [Variovorax sp. PCZ-1]|uniref:SDR family NAD(P)-dependent oxidoreductase n=1 Tax=Variovorax sp. PCZ-1 TaxID=2835533 RepID=UPI001BCB787A|nr:SDR family oxidoreductase [Variovorax sp. PCZ-1]MBS7807352.1 SDR family oxidoreductase [Variovorax sp. PCZ-1]
MNNTTPVAVITGAARGIGLEIARQFVAQGTRVALLDIEAYLLQQAVKTEGLNTTQALALPCDVAVESQVQASIAKVIEQFGRIDTLVNNAGVAVFKPLLAHTAQEWQRVMDVNLTGPFLCTQACAPHMLKNAGNSHGQEKGSIVNIASISGLRASSLRVAYGTSKAALIHLTKQQAVELGNAGIRCNAVAPGPVETAMAKAVHSPEIRRDYHDTIPLARYGSELEIAKAVMWLCSPQASYVNGQCLAVDGGFDASGIGLVSLRDTMN